MRACILAAVIATAAVPCFAQDISPTWDTPSGPTSIPKAPVMFDTAAIDKTADPCTDFYQYACGNWRKANPIPADQVRWGRFNELADRNTYLLYNELKAAAEAPKSPLQKKYGDFFAACMDTATVDKLGDKPIEPQLKEIDALKSGRDLARLNIEFFHQGGGGELINVGVGQDQKDSSQQILQTGQGGLTLPDRDFYLNETEHYKTIRDQYVQHMVRMFQLVGDSPEQAQKEASAVLAIETELAKGSMDRVELRDPAKRYHIMSIAEVQQLTPAYNWSEYLKGIGLADAKSLNVSSPGYLKTANEELASATLPDLKSYLRWHLIHGRAPLLAKPFEDENFAFFSATLNGQKEEQPRWKRCTRMTDAALGEAVGQDWVRQNFPPDAKDNMEKLVHALEAALAQDIQQLPWMSDETKVQAKAKLDAIRDKIGYPAKWRDYSSVTVRRDDLVGNVEHSAYFERERNLHKYGQPVDETEWGMTPPTVNAYYNPPQNDINFPAGILQPPFYDNTKDPAVNFGGIGVVIGHEMTHGFDDQGSKYDLHGNVRVWWTPEDLAKFKDRTECEAKEYDQFEVAPGQNLNGHLTLGENTADNGGIRIAFQALQSVMAQNPSIEPAKLDGYTPDQRFFIAFGQIWCENTREQAARVQAKTDPHSTGHWRVNGTVQNFDEFGKAFGCKAGAPMMPASGGCRVW